MINSMPEILRKYINKEDMIKYNQYEDFISIAQIKEIILLKLKNVASF